MSVRGPYQQRERFYIVDFCRTKYPNNEVKFNVRLGGIPEKLQNINIGDISPNIFKVWNRYADAIVFLPNKLILLEAKLRADIGVVSQIEYYQTLISSTPELQAYAGLPVELHIVCALPDPQLVAYAQSRGIIIDVYQPPYAQEYIKSRYG